jgi:glycosyltransferase involved in cell wall biosynthesis
VASVKAMAGEDTVFTGYIHGDGYRELLSNTFMFAESSSASGTHPALLEAMACGNCVVAHDTPENRETVDGAGLLYPGEEGADGLRLVMQRLIDNPALVEEYRERAGAHVRERYSWDRITDEYLRLFYRLIGD